MPLIVDMRNDDEVSGLEAKVREAAAKSVARLTELLEKGVSGIALIKAMKFEALGRTPLNGADQNICELIDQAPTYLVTFKALRRLREFHPEISHYLLHLGVEGGTDILDFDTSTHVSGDRVAAEVFATVSISNNKKLSQERLRLTKHKARAKYIFLWSPKRSDGRHRQLQLGRQDLQVWSVGDCE